MNYYIAPIKMPCFSNVCVNHLLGLLQTKVWEWLLSLVRSSGAISSNSADCSADHIATAMITATYTILLQITMPLPEIVRGWSSQFIYLYVDFVDVADEDGGK